MNTADIKYLGALRTEATHLRSRERIITDAPVDNAGKGEAFSPTDLIAASLLSCMITVMGIKAERSGWNMGEVSGSVKKVMTDSPRRVAELKVQVTFKGATLSEGERALLERIAINCPVAKSVHPEIEQSVEFFYE